MIATLLLALIQATSVTPAQIQDAVKTAPEARAALNRDMFDYPSARFRDVYVTINLAVEGDRGGYLCGYVNGKNRMGAYAGWRQFVVIGGDVLVAGDSLADSLLPIVCNGDDIAQDRTDRSAWLTSR